MNALEGDAKLLTMGDARLFDFESELERNLTYIPLAVRFKLDICGIKLSLATWQLLSEDRRRELLRAGCENAADVARYRRMLCSLSRVSSGAEPRSIPIDDHPPWAADDVPDQIREAAANLGLRSPSSAQWRALTGLQRFALVKVSRNGHDHRNLGPALQEFGVL